MFGVSTKRPKGVSKYKDPNTGDYVTGDTETYDARLAALIPDTPTGVAVYQDPETGGTVRGDALGYDDVMGELLEDNTDPGEDYQDVQAEEDRAIGSSFGYARTGSGGRGIGVNMFTGGRGLTNKPKTRKTLLGR